MQQADIDQIASTLVNEHLTADIEYSEVFDHEDCADIPEHLIRLIHQRANELLKDAATRLDPDPDRIPLGQPYQPSQLRRSVVVVRQVFHSGFTAFTGSPCCNRITRIPHEDIDYAQDRNRKGFPVYLTRTAKCGTCNAFYEMPVPADIQANRITELEWKSLG
ncbi:hypothetical protein [Nocardia sp. SC052]|uniref:hypothetical protein n=1 Tax=Nocardia sichangensis TaxID=3385975 RepID=UPI00399F9992